MDRRHFVSTAALALIAAGARAQGGPSRIPAAQIGTGHAHASGKMQAMRNLPDLYLADPALRKELAMLPGGGMFELACHLTDAVVTLLGKPSAVQAISTPTEQDGSKDNQLAILTYPKATATIRCNHADPFGGPHRRFQVTGTKGSIEIVPLESGNIILSLTADHDSYKKGRTELKLDVPKGRYDAEFIDLAKAIHGEKPLSWDAAHDVAVHETVLRSAGLDPN